MMENGRLFGFLLGTVLAGGSLYYYVVDEYKVSNTLLTEDIYVRTPLLLKKSFEFDLICFSPSKLRCRG